VPESVRRYDFTGQFILKPKTTAAEGEAADTEE
jgi:hypothetical protein